MNARRALSFVLSAALAFAQLPAAALAEAQDAMPLPPAPLLEPSRTR